jgi:DNA polymerase (family 10)
MADARAEIIDVLRELAELTALDEGSPQAFRVRAYENAKRAVESMEGDLSSMSVAQLVKLDGIGKSTAKKIRDYVDDGRIEKLDTLRAKFPASVVALSHIPGLGPKAVAKLRAELDVQSIDDLRQALADRKLRGLSGFGEKTEHKLARAIERLGLDGNERRTAIGKVMPIARRLVAELEQIPGVEHARYCGSLRRFRETIGDLDIVVATKGSSAPIFDQLVSMPLVDEVLVRGETKTSVLTHKGLQIDVRVVEPDQLGAATLYFTGSKAHNIKLRQRAMDRGWRLNEYALEDSESGHVIASKTEEEIYDKLGLPWIPEPLREDAGEIERALAGNLPEAIAPGELLGDLHVHTTLSGDGRSDIEDMLATANARGYSYLAITDHAEDLAINGVSREALLEQRQRMAELQEQYPDMQLLHGTELNIAPDGSVDYDPDFNMGFDWCVAAVHTHFDLSKAEQTRRIITAMENPAVNVIGHLSGRMIGSRPGIELELDEVLQAAVETDTAIELNSALPRLDAALPVLRRAREFGVTLVISTDAHHVDELDRMQWGIKHALRAWIDKRNVANCWARERFTKWAAAQRQG